MNEQDVIDAWDKADPKAIHPMRRVSEQMYWDSGVEQAVILSRDIPAGSTVIDYGCGDGRVAIPMMEMGYNVIGLDSSDKMGDLYMAECQARNIDGWHFSSYVDTFDNDPSASELDALYCLAVLIHHSYEDGEKLIKRMAHLVKKDGILILDWPTSEVPHEREHWIDVTTWSLQKQTAIEEDLGLQLIASDVPNDDYDLRPWKVYRKA